MKLFFIFIFYRYLLAIAILSTLYSLAQALRHVHELSTGRHLIQVQQRTSGLFDFFGDQVSLDSFFCLTFQIDLAVSPTYLGASVSGSSFFYFSLSKKLFLFLSIKTLVLVSKFWGRSKSSID